MKNKALLCILLKGNPGLDGSISSILLDTVKENSINSHLGKFFSGNKRLDYLSPPLANLLLRWKGLQRNETVKTFMHDISMYSNIEEAEKELLSGSNNYINVPKNNFSGHYSATEQVANVSRIKLVEDRAFSDNIGKLNSPKLVDQKASSRYDTDSFSGDDLDKWKSRILNNNSNNNRHNSNHHDVNEEMITFRGLDRDEEDLPLLDDRIDSFTTRGIDTAKDKIMDDPFEYAVPSPRNQGYELPWNFTPKNRNYTDR